MADLTYISAASTWHRATFDVNKVIQHVSFVEIVKSCVKIKWETLRLRTDKLLGNDNDRLGLVPKKHALSPKCRQCAFRVRDTEISK